MYKSSQQDSRPKSSDNPKKLKGHWTRCYMKHKSIPLAVGLVHCNVNKLIPPKTINLEKVN